MRPNGRMFTCTNKRIIRSREEFLDALKRKNFDWTDYRALQQNLTLADEVAVQDGGQAPVKFRDRRLPDMQVLGTSAKRFELTFLTAPTTRMNCPTTCRFPTSRTGVRDLCWCHWCPAAPAGRSVYIAQSSRRRTVASGGAERLLS